MRSLLILLVFLAACDDEGGASPDPGQQAAVDLAVVEDAAVDAAPPEPDALPPDAAGDAVVVDAGADLGPVVPTGQCGAGDVTGWLYLDEDAADETHRAGERSAGDPAVGEGFSVLTPDGERPVEPCDDGSYALQDLPKGPALLLPPAPENQRCTRRNCPKSFASAAIEGRAVVVVMGDSIPVVGDRPLFPNRLATLFEGLVELDVRNVAVAGSTSPQWLPGQRNYENRLRPELAEADLVIVSLGGNDLLEYMSNPALISNIPAAVAGARELVVTIVERLVTIVQAIREENPGVDVLYCLYPDYTQATTHQLWGLAGRLLGAGTMRDVLETALAAVPEDEDILIADMLNAWDGLDVGLYLYDALHFNAAGQTLYAEEIFQTLGGVHLGESPFGELGHHPLGTEHSFGYEPTP